MSQSCVPVLPFGATKSEALRAHEDVFVFVAHGASGVVPYGVQRRAELFVHTKTQRRATSLRAHETSAFPLRSRFRCDAQDVTAVTAVVPPTTADASS